ncbi:MAG: ABC transporter ATP-binding protein [Pseudomonadota bacterium]
MAKTRKRISMSEMTAMLRMVLGDERRFYALAIIYGLGISLLSLATPISVQMLINTVANTGLMGPLIMLSVTLFFLLLISGLLNALRIHLMEIFGRRFYARMVSEITLRAIYAQNPFFGDDGRTSLFNRYFDIVIVQKTMPYLLIGGFTLILQAAVGFILVSLYHPMFLAFNLVTLTLIWLVWQLWGLKAINAGIDLSHEKHAAAAWLQGLAASNGFYKSADHVANALQAADKVTAAYVKQHRQHFRQHFSQTISYLVIYALASATLLGLGGWLVIQAQLSLGQLVAAELVLSAVFFGVSQLSAYLIYFYDLCASTEELSLVLGIRQEDPMPGEAVPCTNADLVFRSVGGDARGEAAMLNFEIPRGSRIMACAENHGVQRLITNLLKRHEKPSGGYISLGGGDILDMDVYALRQGVMIIDRPTILEGTIRNYLRLNAEHFNPEKALTALKTVGLERTVARLEKGLDTCVATTGWPLSTPETMQLKLAAAILATPHILILNQLYDQVPETCLAGVLNWLREQSDVSLIYFTNREHDLGFDQFLYAENHVQTMTSDFGVFRSMLRARSALQPSITDQSDQQRSLPLLSSAS